MDQEELNKVEATEMLWRPININDDRPTDLTLVLESWRFQVHRDVIIRSSDYFRAMFSSQMIETRQDVVDVKLVNPDVFKVLVEGMYTGEFKLTEDNVFCVVQAAVVLQLSEPLRLACTTFMQTRVINLRQCFEVMYFCIPLNLSELYFDARRFCLAHFSELRHSTGLTNLSLSELYDYLSDAHLVVDDELHVVEAIYTWLCANKSSEPYSSRAENLRDTMRTLITRCVSLRREEEATHDIITDGIFRDDGLPVEQFRHSLSTRPRQEDVFMFWSLLTTTKADGLVDILKLDLETGSAVKVGGMTDIVEKPGFQTGSAICCLGPYVYVCGGGPDFGKTNWIRQIWRFDISKPVSSWETIGDLIEFRRHHTMVILDLKLYIFGGFGKFRTKNTDMHSMDLVTGNWEKLAPIPAHECNLSATTTDNSIYYITSDWNVYSFSLVTKAWTGLTLVTPVFVDEFRRVNPMALISFDVGETKCFAVGALTDDSLKMYLYSMHKETSSLHKLRDAVATTNLFTCAGCIACNGKLVAFFTSQKRDDPFPGPHDSKITLQNAVSFDMRTFTYDSFPDIQNVKEAVSILAMPRLPAVFNMAIRELQ